ncbi:hypothetical protein ACS4JF_30700 [Bacillus thuringiensis]|uniref:hypothetical protein n=1 Tax=Bacillus thuringiensis TaxID=1428 RepID=UPI001FAB8DB3|nr:hypothetical protein [Bacillus thuringiensis]MDM8364850.1 hypothetical protein [Bacillus thuringiensis]
MGNDSKNNKETNKKISPEERTTNMRRFLEELYRMEYSGYLPEESYHVHEKMRGIYL